MPSELEVVLRKRRFEIEDALAEEAAGDETLKRHPRVPRIRSISAFRGYGSAPVSRRMDAEGLTASSPATCFRTVAAPFETQWSSHEPVSERSTCFSGTSPGRSASAISSKGPIRFSPVRKDDSSIASSEPRSRSNSADFAPVLPTPRTGARQELGETLKAISHGTPTWYSWTLAHAERGRRQLAEVPLLVKTVSSISSRLEAWVPQAAATKISDGIQIISTELGACDEALEVFQNPQGLPYTPRRALRTAEKALVRGKPCATVRALATIDTSRRLTESALLAAYGFLARVPKTLNEVATGWILHLQSCAAVVERYDRSPRSTILMNINEHELEGEASAMPAQEIQLLTDRRQQHFPAGSVL